jgi:kynurenine formamidase
MPIAPSEDEILGYYDTLSNWGRWGKDDRLGTLNFITDEVRNSGLALARRGRVVSCAHDIQFGSNNHMRFTTAHGEAQSEETRSRIGREASGSEWIGFGFHGFEITHLDALSHAFFDGNMYNGHPANRVSSRRGAAALPVTDLADGIVTRGVLIDMPRLRGVPWLDFSTPVFPEDLEEAESTQGATVRRGDLLVLNVGQSARKSQGAELAGHSQHPGYHAACMPWLHQRRVAAIGCDTANDVHPSGYENVSVTHPVHTIGLSRMGLWLIDNMNLVDLSETCAELGCYEFLIIVSPLRLEGVTGSPLNPLAIF